MCRKTLTCGKAGFIEAVTRDSAISVVATESANWHTDEALSLTVDLLRLHDHVDAILCANDKMALGALAGIGSHGSHGQGLDRRLRQY